MYPPTNPNSQSQSLICLCLWEGMRPLHVLFTI
nr:unnamed protein product [Callosobruchus analis]